MQGRFVAYVLFGVTSVAVVSCTRNVKYNYQEGGEKTRKLKKIAFVKK